MNSKDRVKQIIDDCCAGNARIATDILHSEFVIIHRDELPTPVMSEHGNGFVTATAQEFYQPTLRFMPDDGDKPGEWNRHIAYGNLAVALAVEARTSEDQERLHDEAYELYCAHAAERGIVPLANWATFQETSPGKAQGYLAIARAARNLYKATK